MKNKNTLSPGMQKLTYHMGGEAKPFKLNIDVNTERNETRILSENYSIEHLIPSIDRQVIKRVARLLHRRNLINQELDALLSVDILS